MTNVLVVYFVPLHSIRDFSWWTCLWLSFSASSRSIPVVASSLVRALLSLSHSMTVKARLVGWVMFPRRGLVHALLDGDTTGDGTGEDAEWMSLLVSLHYLLLRPPDLPGWKSRHSGMVVALTDLISVWHFLPSLCNFTATESTNGPDPLHLASDERREQHRPRSFGGYLRLGKGPPLSGVLILFSFVS